ncbi:hypothetical protein V498_02019 [Pseudogymnoascus sp. VKM F-4517 (FW-2822)]|nr:hypothetical protein V498_02019 [Pseudogymnoascus sp. VKM F-4517 (FW-2822)]
MAAGSRTQMKVDRIIRVKIGDEATKFTIEQSTTVESLKDMIYKKNQIPPDRQRLVLRNHGRLLDKVRVWDVCKEQDLLHLENAGRTTLSADDETCEGETIYRGNTSHDQSTQVNGPVSDGDGPLPMSKCKTTYTDNKSNGKSTQVNGPVSSIHIFKKRD